MIIKIETAETAALPGAMDAEATIKNLIEEIITVRIITESISPNTEPEAAIPERPRAAARRTERLRYRQEIINSYLELRQREKISAAAFLYTRPYLEIPPGGIFLCTRVAQRNQLFHSVMACRDGMP